MTTVQNKDASVVHPWTFNTVAEWKEIAEVNNVNDVDKIASYANSWMGYLPKVMAHENDYENYEDRDVFNSSDFKDKDWFYKTVYLSLCDDYAFTQNIFDLMRNIFNIITYDDKILETCFNFKIIPVLQAIATKQNSSFIDQPHRYLDYVMVINLGDIINLLNWGTSIRGAWFCVSNHEFNYKPFDDFDIVISNTTEITGFIVALICFYKETVALTKEIIETFDGDIKLND